MSPKATQSGGGGINLFVKRLNSVLMTIGCVTWHRWLYLIEISILDSPKNCSFPFTLDGLLLYNCVPKNATDNSSEIGCLSSNSVWIACPPSQLGKLCVKMMSFHVHCPKGFNYNVRRRMAVMPCECVISLPQKLSTVYNCVLCSLLILLKFLPQHV